MCPAPSAGINTVVLPDNLQYGLEYLESYTYSCIEGYNTTDELCTVCQPDGSLSLTRPPQCTGNIGKLITRKSHRIVNALVRFIQQ